MSALRVIVDIDKCIGSGSCVGTEPDVFDQDDDGIVLLLAEIPSPEQVATVRRAAELCPARAILVEE